MDHSTQTLHEISQITWEHKKLDAPESVPMIRDTGDTGSLSESQAGPAELRSAGPNLVSTQAHPSTLSTAIILSRMPVARRANGMPPCVDDVLKGLADIKKLLRPPRKNRKGYRPFALGDGQLQRRLGLMKALFARYVADGAGYWIRASEEVAKMDQYRDNKARTLRSWARAYLADRSALPRQAYGMWNTSLLDLDGLKEELCSHLLGVGKYVRAQDIVDLMSSTDLQLRYGLAKGVSLATAKVWMKKLRYRWGKGPRGQYVDGHERPDVVAYRQSTFLPAFASRNLFTRIWTNGGPAVPSDRPVALRPTVYWYHDESAFSGNDRRKVYWVPLSAKATPEAKGEGPTLMVADFVSADYGWLASPDQTETARVLFRAGKNRDGYFDNDDIIAQITQATLILDKYYPDEDHVFVFDNATTHLKRPPDALSARRMSKASTKAGAKVFGVDIAVKDAAGNIEYRSDG
ncbi:hypothetical protein BN946_scf184909.g55 [Trametes cinnabarina]|uniref:Uncharacterized protein n=1 Tax=Pycnoporus cinnabarinus TaxID=5643 RepID=A0A060SB63_PYCCI|nr:hypothetical protein BN946_scf184909.g55 [Trametes cinnabarina]